MARPRLRAVGATVAALLVLLGVMAPTLLFGQGIGPVDLIVTGGILVVGGLLLRWAGGANTRTPGTIVAVIGALLLAVGVGFTALLLAGAGRGW